MNIPRISDDQQDHPCCSRKESQGDSQSSSCSATLLEASLRTKLITCHTSVTHQRLGESVHCAVFSAVHHWGESY